MCGISWDIIVSIDILWTCEEDDQSANVRFPAAWRRCWQKLKLTWMSPAGRHDLGTTFLEVVELEEAPPFEYQLYI